MIKYIQHSEIDLEKWDNCIEKAHNSLPYAFSWWLNAVSPDWDALIYEDYYMVMPLTRKRKMGFDYLYQPYFTQQLGIFSADQIDSIIVDSFLKAIPLKFRYIDIQVNAFNYPADNSFVYRFKKNHLLDLNLPYINLATSFHRNCRRNINKAQHAGFKVKKGPGAIVFSNFVKKNLGLLLNHVDKDIYSTLYNISNTSLALNKGDIWGVYNPSEVLVAAGWFVSGQGRYLFVVCASTPEGKENKAMYLLIDHVIREKSGSPITLDFTGSEMPGVAYFNEGFGTIKTTYLSVKKNRLPGLFKLFKK